MFFDVDDDDEVTGVRAVSSVCLMPSGVVGTASDANIGGGGGGDEGGVLLRSVEASGP